MARRLATTGIFVLLAASALLSAGCSGSDGAAGPTGTSGTTGPTGDVGPTGPSGTSDPSINGITPGKVFLDRTADITISGNGTVWTAATTVDFGAKVKVNKLTLASPTALVANVTVEPDAVLGARDVKVSEGGKDLTYAGAFELQSPVKIAPHGTIAQGSLAVITATDLDFTAPFDTTSTGDGFFTPIVYTNIQVSAVPGMTASINAVAPYTLDMLMFMDVDVTAGAKDLDILSGPAGSQVHFPYPGALTVAARTPKDISLTAANTGTIAKAYESELFKLTPAAGDSLISVQIETTSADATPGLVAMPKSGKFADLIAFSASHSIVSSATDPYYFVVWDNTGASNFPYTITATQTQVTGAAEQSPNESASQAQQATALPFLLKGATLTSETDEDWIKLTATAGDVGKSIHVVTMPGDADCDPVVDVFESDGVTSLGGPSDDANYHEDFTSTPITAAGIYYVNIYASSGGYFSASSPNYVALITLE